MLAAGVTALVWLRHRDTRHAPHWGTGLSVGTPLCDSPRAVPDRTFAQRLSHGRPPSRLAA